MLNLSHRERFFKCMNHEDTDRVPVDLWLDTNDPNVKKRLLDYAGFDKYEQILDFFDIDMYRFKPAVVKEKLNPASELEEYFVPSSNVKYMTHSSEIPRPLMGVEEAKELDKFVWPSEDVFDYQGMAKEAATQKNRVLSIQAGTWSPIFCRMCDLAGMEKVMMDMILNPKLTEATVEKLFEFYYKAFKKTLEATKGIVDIFSFGDDYASQLDLMFDLKYWRQYFKKPVKELCALAKSYGVLVSFHSCGAVTKLIPELIEAGVDILFPIQPRAAGMDAENLKKEFGRDIVFYGGIDLQEILPHGTEKQVRDEVNRVTGILGKGGGYIMASGHAILSDVPQANIMAMYDEARKTAFR